MKALKRENIKIHKPILYLNQKNYSFSIFSILMLIVGGPLLCVLIFLFLSLRYNYWLYELTAKQIWFVLNNIFNVNSQVIIYNEEHFFPTILIPNHPFSGNFSITTECIAAHVFSIIIGLFVCVPSSEDSFTKEDFTWRKITVLIISIFTIHILNVFRVSLLLFLNFHGIPFEFIHQSLFFISAIIGALFLAFLLHKRLPEILISIYYIYPLINQKRNVNQDEAPILE